MPSEKDILRRALGRLGRVPPEALSLSRQRVLENLKIDHRLVSRVPPPDATPADLTVLRRPFYIGGAMALLCLVIVGGAVVRWRLDRRSASTLAQKSASTQASEAQASVQPPRPVIEAPPSVSSTLSKPNKTQASK